MRQRVVRRQQVAIRRAWLLVWMGITVLCLAGLRVAAQQRLLAVKGTEQKQLTPEDIFDKGMELAPVEVGKLEASLRLNPDEAVVHTQLLGYYFSRPRSAEGPAKYMTHLEWFIRQHPESEVLRTRCFDLPTSRAAEYPRVEQLWEEQIKLHKEDARVYGNAAWFLDFGGMRLDLQLLAREEGINTQEGVTDQDLTDLQARIQAKEDQRKVQVVHWLQQAQRLDSRNPEWPERLGTVYRWRMIAVGTARPEAEVRESGKLASQYFEQAFQLTRDENARIDLWKKMAMVAFETGEYARAEEYAADLLKRTDTQAAQEDLKDREHYADMILGRLALKRGDAKGAERYLLAAGNSVGLATQILGPHMALVVDLLAQGRKERVLSYLELCGKFWHKEKIDQWTLQIKEEQTPDFGIQRFY